MSVIRPASIVELDRVDHVLLERQQDVAAVDDDAAVDPVVLAAGQHHAARRPVIPLTRAVDVAVLGFHGIADAVGHIGARAVREAQRARSAECLDGRVGAALQLLRREHAREQVDRLDAREDPRPRCLDLGELVGEEHEQRLDDHVHALENVDRRTVAGERRLADRPHADLSPARRRRVREPEVHRPRTETLRCGHERVDVLGALLALGEHDERLVLAELAEPEHRARRGR